MLVDEHPRGIRPFGASLMVDGAQRNRLHSLGLFSPLSDSIILDILGYCDPKSLCRFAQASQYAYAFSSSDDLWRVAAMSQMLTIEAHFSAKPSPSVPLWFHKCWRYTYALKCVTFFPLSALTLEWFNGIVDQGVNAIIKTFSDRYPQTAQRPLKVKGVFSDILYKPFQCAHAPIDPDWIENDNIQRRDVSSLSVNDFIREFERPRIPVVLRGAMCSWPSTKLWEPEHLMNITAGSTFSCSGFQIGMKDFFHYQAQISGSSASLHSWAVDDQPLYLFDRNFCEKVPLLKEHYKLPKYFASSSSPSSTDCKMQNEHESKGESHDQDLFALLGDRRPHYRWIIVGPKRSGSSWHQDPNRTSAWNAVVRGRKKWILLPPDIIPPGVHASEDFAHVVTPVSVMEWFIDFYGALKHLPAKQSPIIECIVEEGEVMFIPSGWWHIVLNLEDSIAITQNYVSAANLEDVLQFTKFKKDQVSGYDADEDKQTLHKRFSISLQRNNRSGIVSALNTDLLDPNISVTQRNVNAMCSLSQLFAEERDRKRRKKGGIDKRTNEVVNREEADTEATFSFGFNF